MERKEVVGMNWTACANKTNESCTISCTGSREYMA